MQQIRLCKTTEIPKLQAFINNFWRPNHILSRDADLLRFQYHDKIRDSINFVVAVDERGEFTAILGFIPTWQYDEHLYEHGDFWLAIWCKDELNCKVKGFDLLKYLVEFFKPRSVAAIGITESAKRLYTKNGFTIGELNHWYYFKQPTNIAYLKSSKFSISQNIFANTFTEIIDWPGIRFSTAIPQKTKDYFFNRYYNHPKYKYKFLAVYEKDAHDGNDYLIDVLVVRLNKVDVYKLNGNCLRIVDAINHFKKVGDLRTTLNNLIQCYDAEYIDCINFGIPNETFARMSFTKKDPDKIVIPNYFEPFEQRNVKLEFAYKVLLPTDNTSNILTAPNDATASYVIFKGDSDQDRPNQ